MESSYTTKAQLESSLQRVAGKIESAEDKIDVLSGVANSITARIEGAEGDISSLQTQVDDISVPTKTSELTNDSGYIKSVNGKSANAAGAVSLVPSDIGAASNHNLLDNWYFANPVNQRGLTSYGLGYTIDRWASGTGGPTISLTNNGLTIGTGDFVQAIEISDMIPDTYTLSVLTSDNKLTSFSFNIEPNVKKSNVIDSGTGFYLFFISYAIASCHNVVISNVSFNGTFIAVKLESGDKQTLAHKDASGNWVLNDPPPNKALELLKCQRYAQEISGLYPILDRFGGDAVWFFVPTPTLRAAATITGLTNGKWRLISSGTVLSTPTIQVHTTYKEGVVIQVNKGTLSAISGTAYLQIMEGVIASADL